MDFRARIVEWLAAATGQAASQIDEWVEVPPQPELGDFAFPCFRLARLMRQAPASIAADLSGRAKAGIDGLERVEAVQGYLNFFISRSAFISQIVLETLLAGEALGRTDEGRGKTVIVEFSSPNIAKPFHIGHAFTTFSATPFIVFMTAWATGRFG